MMLGYREFGTGSECVLVMHDFFSDTTTYDGVLSYLDTKRFKFVFADLRGYGKSKHLKGEYTNAEVSSDAFALADHLGWDHFHVVGHSMSGMFAQYMAKEDASRLKSIVGTCPVPASGSPMPQDLVGMATQASEGNEDLIKGIIHYATGNKMSEGFVAFKTQQFLRSSTHEARMGYMRTFTQSDFSKDVEGNQVPILVISGGHDGEHYQEANMRNTILKWFVNGSFGICQDAGHFPNQQSPALLVALMEKHMARFS